MADVMPDTRPAPQTPQAPGTEERLSVVGTSPAHHDFVDKVKGSLLYAADWKLPGMDCRARPVRCRCGADRERRAQ
jgi:hypothetical protein